MENLNLINQDFSTQKYQNYKTFRNTDNYPKEHCADCCGDTNKKQNLIRTSPSTSSIPPQLMVYERASVYLDECDSIQNQYNPRNSNYSTYKNDDLEISGTKNWISSASSSYNSNNTFQLPPAEKYCSHQYNNFYNKESNLNNNRCYNNHSIGTMNLKGNNYYDNNCIQEKENRSLIYGTGSGSSLKNQSRIEQIISSTNLRNPKKSTKICTIVFVSLIFISIINGTLRGAEYTLNLMKFKLDNLINKFWKKWDLSCLVRNKKSTQFTVLILSPILATIGICYSLICVSLIINTKLKCSVPNSLIKRINFNRLLGNS